MYSTSTTAVILFFFSDALRDTRPLICLDSTWLINGLFINDYIHAVTIKLKNKVYLASKATLSLRTASEAYRSSW